MVNRNTFVEINGKRYDARTGKVIETVPIARAARPPQPQVHASAGLTPRMDGFVRRSQVLQPAKTQYTHKAQPQAAQKPANAKPHRIPAPSALQNRHQKSKTLMRSAVKNPATKPKLSPVQAPIDIHIKRPVETITAPAKLPPHAQVPRSAFISRFGTPAESHSVVKRTAHVPVKSAPIVSHTNTTHHASTRHGSDLFAEALKSATSHEQAELHTPKKEHANHKSGKKIGLSRRVVNIAAITVMVFMLGGFVAYQNAANLSMRVATAKAGINGTLPKYQPAGFSIGDIAAQPGIITVSFNSNSDDRSYDVSQRVSNWNSETLLTNYINVGNRSYQTFQDKGKTIFIYDGSKAAWVNGGVMYEIIGNSALSSDQLLKIASSL